MLHGYQLPSPTSFVLRDSQSKGVEFKLKAWRADGEGALNISFTRLNHSPAKVFADSFLMPVIDFFKCLFPALNVFPKKSSGRKTQSAWSLDLGCIFQVRHFLVFICSQNYPSLLVDLVFINLCRLLEEDEPNFCSPHANNMSICNHSFL